MRAGGAGRAALRVPPLLRPGRRGALARLLAGPLVGVVGPLVLWPGAVLHVTLPVMAALHGRPARAAPERAADAHRVAEGLEWLLGLYGWTAMVAPRLPRAAEPPPVALPRGDAPPALGAVRPLARLVTGVPETLVLLLMGAALLPLWLGAVAGALITGRQPVLVWRIQARLLLRRAEHLRRHAALAGARASGRAPAAAR